MKFSIPPLEISENEGFSKEKDIFKRKKFGEVLLKLVSSVENEIIIALDASWGEGKTTFIKMWRGLLTENDIKNIYFDAFANDYIDDPFTALSGEIYEMAKKVRAPKKKIDKYKEEAINIGKVLLKSGVKIGIKTLTAGVLDGTELEKLAAGKGISSKADKTEQYLLNSLESYKADKMSLDGFRKSVKELAEAVSKGDKPLVFIIDELDRCRPTFSLELLEKIKHIFSVPKIVFVLVMNREQLEESVKCQYGPGINATQYLQKFVNIWCHLPKRIEDYSGDALTYLWYLLKQHDYPTARPLDEDIIKSMTEYINHFSPTLRELEQIVINLIIVRITINMQDFHRFLLPFLAIVKVINYKMFKKLKEGKSEFVEVFNNFNLVNLVDRSFKGKTEQHILTWLLRYCLIPEPELKNQENNYFEGTGIYAGDRKDVIPYICKAMSTFLI